MKFEMQVQVYLRAVDRGMSAGHLQLSETQTIELSTLSDAAGILVKLHEFFEVLKSKAIPK